MAGTTSYYHCDASGNVRALTDSNQNVTDRYTYDAFGNTVAQSGTTENNFRFGGQVGYHLNPDSGSYYVRAREYQPAIIGWLSMDPLGFVDGMNLYQYVDSNPIIWTDPTGYCKLTIAIAPKPYPDRFGVNDLEEVLLRDQTIRLGAKYGWHVIVAESPSHANREVLNVLSQNPECCIENLKFIGHGNLGRIRIGGKHNPNGYPDLLRIDTFDDPTWVPLPRPFGGGYWSSVVKPGAGTIDFFSGVVERFCTSSEVEFFGCRVLGGSAGERLRTFLERMIPGAKVRGFTRCTRPGGINDDFIARPKGEPRTGPDPWDKNSHIYDEDCDIWSEIEAH